MADSLFTKYRPKTFADYTGDDIKKSIDAWFCNGKVPHTILLYGNLGCGKTTAARLLTKEYMCVDKKDGHACGQCYACKEIEDVYIETGNEVANIQEVDIASDSKKDVVMQIIDDAKIEPMLPAKYKIVILDEFHKASDATQNMLLKTLEEPPEHLVIIACTTEPDKIIPTVRSRFQLKLQVKKPSIEQLTEILMRVCKLEGIKTSVDALKLIANKSGRVPRIALQSLEQVANESGNVVTLETLGKLLDDSGNSLYLKFYSACTAPGSIMENLINYVSKELIDKDYDLLRFIPELIKFTLSCMKIRFGIGLELYGKGFVETVNAFFKVYSTDELDTLMQILEYAIKLANGNPDNIELIIINTGLRIGKISILSSSLEDSASVGERENKIGTSKYIDNQKLNTSNTDIKSIKEIDDVTMASVYGGGYTEVKDSYAGLVIDSIEDDSETEEAEKLNKFFEDI